MLGIDLADTAPVGVHALNVDQTAIGRLHEQVTGYVGVEPLDAVDRPAGQLVDRQRERVTMTLRKDVDGVSVNDPGLQLVLALTRAFLDTQADHGSISSRGSGTMIVDGGGSGDLQLAGTRMICVANEQLASTQA